jgi:hypothetical protein
MVRQLVLTGTRDAELFDTLFRGFCLGRVVTLQVDLKGDQTREDRRVDLVVLRALERVSDPDPNAPKAHGDVIARRLRDGETLTLQQADFVRLEKYLNRAPWDTGKLADVEDGLDRLSSAEKIDA